MSKTNTIVKSFLFISFLLASQFVFLFSTTGQVSADNKKTPEEIAKAWQAGMALGNCAAQYTTYQFYPKRKPEEINDGYWFGGSTFPGSNQASTHKKNVGRLLEPDNGEIVCGVGDDIKILTEALGIKNHIDFLTKDTGIYEYKDGWYNRVLDKEKARSAIKSYAEKKFGFSYAKMDNPTKYALLLAPFKSQCLSDPERIEESEEAVTIVDPATGKSEPKKLALRAGMAGKKVEVGYTVSNDNDLTCAEIRDGLNKYAKDYEKRIKELLDAGVDTSGNSDGTDNAVSCTEQFGISFGWVICQMLEAVGDTVGALFGFVDGILNIDGQIINSDYKLRAVWSYFRAIATFLLVIIGLVMVISQAIGGKG